MYIVIVINGIVGKHLLQKFIFVSRDISLCVRWLFTSPWIDAHRMEYGWF